MDEFIRRRDAVAVFGDVHPLDYNAQAYLSRIKQIPAADVRPVLRGRWTYKEGGELCADGYYCTACGTGFHVHVPYFAEFNFCPNCGAQMDMKEG